MHEGVNEQAFFLPQDSQVLAHFDFDEFALVILKQWRLIAQQMRRLFASPEVRADFFKLKPWHKTLGNQLYRATQDKDTKRGACEQFSLEDV